MEVIDPGFATVAAAAIALLGAAIGFIVSQTVEYFRINKESKNRQRERLVEKRISAHELVIGLCQDMVAMKPVNAKSDDSFPRGPWVLESVSAFENFYRRFVDIHSESSTWLWIETKRELNFCQDYFLILYGYLSRSHYTEHTSRTNH